MFAELKHVAALTKPLGGAQARTLLSRVFAELKHVAALTKPLGGAQARTLLRAAYI